jgi:hypothetical protein
MHVYPARGIQSFRRSRPACCDQDVIQRQIMPSAIHLFRMFRPDEVSVDFAAVASVQRLRQQMRFDGNRRPKT